MQSKGQPQAGFTMVEMVGVLAAAMILSGFATFSLTSFMRSYQAGADARSIASQISLARMRASSAFDQTRVAFNFAARTYQIELRIKGTDNFMPEGGTYFLSRGVEFGTGGMTFPAGDQTTMQQSQSIRFNSRGIPIDDTEAPIGEYAIYLTNNSGLNYAVTVSQTGRVSVWENVGSAWLAR